MKTAMEKALEEIDSDSFLDEEGDRVILIKFAKEILQQFEIDLLNELDCEKLEKLKK